MNRSVAIKTYFVRKELMNKRILKKAAERLLFWLYFGCFVHFAFVFMWFVLGNGACCGAGRVLAVVSGRLCVVGCV